jgi:protocatechuate 3,4-dioxygenase beta subunit
VTGTRSLTIAFATLALAGSLHGLLSAQQNNPLVGTGVVSGQVVVGGTNTPVPGAIVTLFIVSSLEPVDGTLPSGPRPAPQVISDAQGRFVFSGVPAGEFQLRASRNGWQTGALGVDGPFQPQGMVVSAASPGNGQVFKLAAGERFRASVPVWPNAIIRGQVTDEAGEPIAGAYVQAMRWYMAGSRRRLGGTDLHFADNRGFFTLSVPPGEYVVGAASEQVRIARDPATGSMRRFVFRDTFFPNASGTFDAVPVTLKSGEERSGIFVRMSLVRAMRLTGVLNARDAGRQPPRLQLIAVNEGVRAYPAQAVDPQGRFLFDNLPAGRYILQTSQTPFPASDPATPAELWVSTEVEIGNRDVDVSIESHRKILVSGRVEFDGAATIPSRQVGISAGVLLIRDDALPSDIGAGLIPVGPDGRFTVATTPGRFVVSAGITAVDVRNETPEVREALVSSRVWSLRSAMLSGHDVADTGLTITSDVTNLVLTFTDRRTALTGKVTARQGSIESAYLMVFPSDEKLRIDYGFGRRMRVMRLAADGAFNIAGLPEGDYLVASFRSSASDREVRNPAFLRALTSSARRVSLREGASVTQDVELLSSPPVKALNAALAPSSMPPAAVERAAAREAAAETATTGATITGTVVDASSQQPLAGVRVGITAPVMQAPSVGGAFTDDRGRFTLAVPAGQHTLYVSKPMYVTTAYGAARPGDAGTPVTVANGQVLSDIAVQLVKGASIGGRVLDHNGQPAPDALLNIRAYRWQARGRELLPTRGASVTGIFTNALGEYRAWGFPPGDYIVQVSPQGNLPTPTPVTTQADLDAAQRPGAGMPVSRVNLGYVPTYYPNTIDSAAAAIVKLNPGDDRVLDMQLSLIPMAVVSGVARTPDGTPARLSLTLTPNDPAAPSPTRTLFSTVDDSGAFTFRDVPPGRYRLAPPAAQLSRSTLSAALDLVVDGDRSGLVLDLVPGARVSGQLGGDGLAGARQPGVRIALTPLTTFVQPAQAMTSAIDADSRFSFPNVPPGRYRLELTAPATVVRPRVAAQIVNGVDTIETGLELKGGEQIDVAAEVTVSEARLAGRVLDRAGRPLVQHQVVLFPAEPGSRTPPSRRIFAVRPDQNGRYSLPDVPSGDYLITATADIEPGDWFNPDTLARLAPTAAPVRIRRGDTLEIDLETR